MKRYTVYYLSGTNKILTYSQCYYLFKPIDKVTIPYGTVTDIDVLSEESLEKISELEDGNVVLVESSIIIFEGY